MPKGDEEWEEFQQWRAFKDLQRSKGVDVEQPLPSDGGGEPEPKRSLPQVEHPRRGVPLKKFAYELGNIIKDKGFYRNHGRVVEVDLEDGMIKEVSSQAFRTRVEDYAFIYVWDKDGEEKLPMTMGKEVAAGVIASKFLLDHLPPLKRVNRLRVPAMGEDGKPRLLPYGYDDLTQTYTLEGIAMEENLSREDAVMILKEELELFEWEEDDLPFMERRSVSVQVAAMVSAYGRLMLPANERPPSFMWTANRPESGKSVLAKIVLAVGFGDVTSSPIGRDDEFRKQINSLVYNGVEHLFLDNVKQRLDNAILEAFMTSPTHGDRTFGGGGRFNAENRVWIYVTANYAVTSDDLARRFLVVSLFSQEGDPTVRQIPSVRKLTNSRLLSANYRSRITSALWAIIREWGNDEKRYHDGRIMGSFEKWSEIFGGMTMGAGFSDPCAVMPEGQEISKELGDFRALMRVLLGKLLESDTRVMEWSFAAKLHDDPPGIVDICREHALFVDLIGTSMDDVKEMRTAKSWRASFGRLLGNRKGSKWTIDGHRLVFGMRGEKHRKYRVRFEGEE